MEYCKELYYANSNLHGLDGPQVPPSPAVAVHEAPQEREGLRWIAQTSVGIARLAILKSAGGPHPVHQDGSSWEIIRADEQVHPQPHPPAPCAVMHLHLQRRMSSPRPLAAESMRGTCLARCNKPE